MSTKRRGKAKQRGRKATRPNGGRGGASLAVFDGLCKELVLTDGRDLLRPKDPLQPELWASHVLAMFRSHTLVGEADTAAAIGGRLVSVAQRNRTPGADACLRGMAAVADGQLGQKARRAVGQLQDSKVPVPSWIEAIGTAAPSGAWRASDLFGDQDSVMVGFAYPDGPEHTVMVLVDHVLGGIAKDAAVLGPLSELLREWRQTEYVELVEEPVAAAAGRIVEAMDWTARTLAAPVSEDYTELEAFVRARLTPLAGDVQQAEPLSPEQREALVKAFLADPLGALYADDPAAWYLLDALVDYRCDDQDGDPLRWSPAATELFLLDYVPRKLSAHRATLEMAPDVLRVWATWASGRAGLPPSLLDDTLAVVDETADEFAAALDDESRWGPAKSVVMRMLADGVDVSDTEAANAWIASQVLDVAS